MTKRNLSAKKQKVAAKKKTFGKLHTMDKSKGSAIKKSKASTNPNRPDPSGGKPFS